MNISHLPTGENIPKAMLETLYQSHDYEPSEYPTLAHSITLPSSWQKINDLQSVQIDEMKPLAVWQPKGNHGIYPSIQVHATELTQEISAHNWLRYYLAKSGSQILNLQIESVSFADSLVKSQTSEQVVIKRIVVVIHGPII